MEIQRYRTRIDAVSGEATVYPDDQGNLVGYGTHIAEVERLAAENVRLRGALTRIRDGEYEFVKYHARQLASKALAEAVRP